MLGIYIALAFALTVPTASPPHALLMMDITTNSTTDGPILRTQLSAPNVPQAGWVTAAAADASAAGGKSCLSHDVYISVSASFAVGHDPAALGQQHTDHSTQVVLIVILGVISLALLLYGTQFTTGALAILIFLVVFSFVFGVLDALLYHASSALSFASCVMPLMLSIVLGIFFSVLSLCLVQRVSWLAFFLLGAALGAVAMLLLRAILIAADPSMPSQNGFGWFWVAAGSVTLGAGTMAAVLKKVVYVATCIVVGSYGVATFVSAIVTVAGGQPIGFGGYVGCFLGAACLGAAAQYLQSQSARSSAPPPSPSAEGESPPRGKGETYLDHSK